MITRPSRATLHMLRALLDGLTLPHVGPGVAFALLVVPGARALFGAAGRWLTGSQRWFLAIPGALALGWLFVANPQACVTGLHNGSACAGQGRAA